MPLLNAGVHSGLMPSWSLFQKMLSHHRASSVGANQIRPPDLHLISVFLPDPDADAVLLLLYAKRLCALPDRHILTPCSQLQQVRIQLRTVDIDIPLLIIPLHLRIKIDRADRKHLRLRKHLPRNWDPQLCKHLLRCLIQHAAAAFLALIQPFSAQQKPSFHDQHA